MIGVRAPIPHPTDLTYQPGDLTFVVDRLEEAKGDVAFLKRMIDFDHIGAAGHSQGTLATLHWATNICCQDPRVDAAVTFASTDIPASGDRKNFTGRAIPLLMIHGDNDHVTAYEFARQVFEHATGATLLVTVIGEDHLAGTGLEGDAAVNAAVHAATLDYWASELYGDKASFAQIEFDVVIEGKTTLETRNL